MQPHFTACTSVRMILLSTCPGRRTQEVVNTPSMPLIVSSFCSYFISSLERMKKLLKTLTTASGHSTWSMINLLWPLSRQQVLEVDSPCHNLEGVVQQTRPSHIGVLPSHCWVTHGPIMTYGNSSHSGPLLGNTPEAAVPHSYQGPGANFSPL
jgi:hypothetical protein